MQAVVWLAAAVVAVPIAARLGLGSVLGYLVSGAEPASVVVASLGQVTGRLLRAFGYGVTVLDVDSEQVELLGRFGQKVFYGDASRLDLLPAAGAGEAKVLIVAVDAPEKVAQIVDTAHNHFPHLAILGRARGRTEAYDLLDREIEGVYRETFDTAVHTGVDALRLLGVPAHAATRAGVAFRRADEASIAELRRHRGEGEAFVTEVRERMRDVEEVLRADRERLAELDDDAWEGDRLRDPPPA